MEISPLTLDQMKLDRGDQEGSEMYGLLFQGQNVDLQL